MQHKWIAHFSIRVKASIVSILVSYLENFHGEMRARNFFASIRGALKSANFLK